MADEHEAAAVVELGQIRLQGLLHVGDPQRGIGFGARPRRPGQSGAGERHLPVHRRVDLAVLRVARGLVEGDRPLGVLDLEVAVPALLVADGRVDVEAVDRGIALRLRVLDADRLGQRGVVDRGRETRGARVGVGAGLAQPTVPLAAAGAAPATTSAAATATVPRAVLNMTSPVGADAARPGRGRRNLRHEAERVPKGTRAGRGRGSCRARAGARAGRGRGSCRVGSDHGGKRSWHFRILVTSPWALTMQCNSLLALGLLVALNVVEKVVALDTAVWRWRPRSRSPPARTGPRCRSGRSVRRGARRTRRRRRRSRPRGLCRSPAPTSGLTGSRSNHQRRTRLCAATDPRPRGRSDQGSPAPARPRRPTARGRRWRPCGCTRSSPRRRRIRPRRNCGCAVARRWGSP